MVRTVRFTVVPNGGSGDACWMAVISALASSGDAHRAISTRSIVPSPLIVTTAEHAPVGRATGCPASSAALRSCSTRTSRSRAATISFTSREYSARLRSRSLANSLIAEPSTCTCTFPSACAADHAAEKAPISRRAELDLIRQYYEVRDRGVNISGPRYRLLPGTGSRRQRDIGMARWTAINRSWQRVRAANCFRLTDSVSRIIVLHDPLLRVY